VSDVPIQKIGRILIASIQTDLSDESTLALQGALSNRIIETGARGVIIDISALEIVDSFIGRMLATIASMSRLLDADTVVVGMRPAVAITLTELGLSLGGVRTALNAEMALKLLGQSGWDGAQAAEPVRVSAVSDDDSTSDEH
jgi:rsbT antagonist protein RsbS